VIPDHPVRRDPHIRLARPDFDEQEVQAVREVLDSGILTNGPRTRAFEAGFAARHDVDHGVAFATGTVALGAIYMALGIGPGDEVIVPSLTFISTATSILHVGAVPVFADVDPETFNVDPADASRRLSPRTKAIIAVHYGGQPADLAELVALADEAGVALLEDAAEAHGATYRGLPVGGFGRAAMFSFTGTKSMSIGEGGMVTTNDGALAGKLRLLRNHGQTGLYRHEVLGYNWRLSEMQAAIGTVQLQKLDAILARKRANARWMTARLDAVPGLTPPVTRPDRDHVYTLYSVLVGDDRDRALAVLNEAGIESKVYFPPAHQQPVLERFTAELPVTEALAGRMLSLPFHSRLTAEQLEEMAATLAAAIAPATTQAPAAPVVRRRG
jgi:perosamine synthetase